MSSSSPAFPDNEEAKYCLASFEQLSDALNTGLLNLGMLETGGREEKGQAWEMCLWSSDCLSSNPRWKLLRSSFGLVKSLFDSSSVQEMSQIVKHYFDPVVPEYMFWHWKARRLEPYWRVSNISPKALLARNEPRVAKYLTLKTTLEKESSQMV
jgi:hypothetical protein